MPPAKSSNRRSTSRRRLSNGRKICGIDAEPFSVFTGTLVGSAMTHPPMKFEFIKSSATASALICIKNGRAWAAARPQSGRISARLDEAPRGDDAQRFNEIIYVGVE